MDKTVLLETFGYIGSVLVVVSMLMSSIVKLRIFNTIGSIISTIYAFIIGTLPLALMNICLIIINGYNLIKLFSHKNSYDLVEGKSTDSLVQYEIKRYSEDIKQYFPGFSEERALGKTVYFVCCNGIPAGLMIGQAQNDNFDLLIDYSTPTYRDCTVGQFLYKELKQNGFKTITYAEKLTDAHLSYLKKVGFSKEAETFIKTL